MQQVRHEPDHPLRLVADNADERAPQLPLLHRAVVQRFRIALDRRQRRAQLMRYIRDELPPRLLQLLLLRYILQHRNRARDALIPAVNRRKRNPQTAHPRRRLSAHDECTTDGSLPIACSAVSCSSIHAEQLRQTQLPSHASRRQHLPRPAVRDR